MIVNADAKALEINGCAYLSQDEILLQEIWNNVDIHEENRKRFNLPTRLIAKTFVFRLIYGGSAYSYANDPDFTNVSTNEKFWQKVIDAFYEKYSGVYDWHKEIIQTVTMTGKLVMPTGRQYNYAPKPGWGGGLKWPETTIKNYPVQGLGADIMAIIRVDFARRFKQLNYGVLVSTVHDSIVVDIHKEYLEDTVKLFNNVFKDMPKRFYNLFNVEYNLPLKCECSYGNNMKELEEYK